MSELKSAWEIAQEKANKLGKLSSQEIQRQREQKCRQIAEATAQKYLDSAEPLNLATELNNYPLEERDLIGRAILNHLIQAMGLESWSGTSPDPTNECKIVVAGFIPASQLTRCNRSGGVHPRLEKIVQGIAAMGPNLQSIVEQIRELSQEYEQAAGKSRQAIENRGREILHQLRVSGTAVDGINIEATQEWQQSWHKLSEPFALRLDGLKQELINSI